MTTEAAAVVRPTFLRRHRWKILLMMLLVAATAVMGLWLLVTLSFSYSTGERVGFIQKFSHKGWVCRTWEGELAMTPVPGSAPQMFWFTVRDDRVAKRVADAAGKRVALHYEEKRGVPSSCFGDTQYFVTEVKVLGP